MTKNESDLLGHAETSPWSAVLHYRVFRRLQESPAALRATGSTLGEVPDEASSAGKSKRAANFKKRRHGLRKATAIVMSLLAAAVIASCQRPVSEEKEPPKTENKTAVARPQSPPVERASVPGVIQSVKQRGELRVGMQIGYVPFQMPGSEGNVVGFDVDTAELAARSLKVQLRIVRLTWSELIPSLLDGTTDVVMSGMTVTPEHNVDAVFTIPVLESGRMFLVHATGAKRFMKFEDLDQAGIFVVSRPGGLGGLKLKRMLPKASYREFPNRARAVTEVMEKRAHALVDDEFGIRQGVSAHPEALASSFKSLSYEPIAWAIRPGDPHWLNWLNNLIRAIKKDGRLDELKKKWLQDYFLDIHGRSRHR